MKKLFLFFFLLLFLTGIFGFSASAQVNPWKGRSVISVIDGDTLVLDNGEVIRLIGVLSPKARHGKQQGEPLGDEARLITEELLLGRQIEISFDIVYGQNGHRDKYGRALVYVTIQVGAGKDVANAELLRRGAGYYSPGNVELEISGLLKSAEAEGKKNRAGIWSKLDKSPVETALASGSSFQEPPPSLDLQYIRPAKPITEGPGVKTTVATVQDPPKVKPPAKNLDMDDLSKTKTPPPQPKKTEIIDPESVYEMKTKVSTIASAIDGTKMLEVYKATRQDNSDDYRVSVLEDGKAVTFITNYNGLKNFASLIGKAAEEQPRLTSIETAVGSLSGERGSIAISTGKDGGLNIKVNGKNVYLPRLTALGIQTKILNSR
ncbi:MAG: thermonuclease family protein [Blastocatellia bacterium]|nr:thermonuclease family protein [Blastocatellia bacterium]